MKPSIQLDSSSLSAVTKETLVLGSLLETGKAHALVVEADPEVRLAIMVRLLRAGYRVSVAASGHEALTFALRCEPGVVLVSASLAGRGAEQVLDGLVESPATSHLRALVYQTRHDALTPRHLARHPAVYALVHGMDVMMSDRLHRLIDDCSREPAGEREGRGPLER